MNSSTEEKVYRKVADVSEVPPGTSMRVTIENDDIALFNRNGELYAINDLCPHRGASLSDGFLEQDKVFCPWHCFDFNLKTGESQVASHLRVATYPVKVEDGSIFILY
jgi:NAD(P)H-dependent nitrite reductase small subunit